MCSYVFLCVPMYAYDYDDNACSYVFLCVPMYVYNYDMMMYHVLCVPMYVYDYDMTTRMENKKLYVIMI